MNKKSRIDVNSLEIQHFRGISSTKTLDFTNNKIIVLWGENGTGKSSYVNAFEYLFKGKLDSLKFSFKGNKKAFLHQGSNEEDFKIKLKFDRNKEFYRDINGENIDDFNDIFSQHISFLSEASFILTRKKLLSFINATDGERHEALMDLCGLKEIEDVRNEINKTKNYYKNELKSKTQRLNNSKQKLKEILSMSDDGEDFISQINEILKSLNKDEINESTKLDEYLLQLDFPELHNIKKLEDLISTIEIDSCKSEFNNLLINRERVNNDSLANLQYSNDLLVNSKKYLESTGDEICPVCDNEIDNKKALLLINNKLSIVNDSLKSFNEWKNKTKEFISNLNNLKSKIIDINHYLGELSSEIKIDEEYINNLINDLKDLILFKVTSIELKEKYDFKRIIDGLNSVENLINSNELSLIDMEKYEKIHKMKLAIHELDSFNQLKDEVNISNSKFQYINNIFEEFKESKKEFLIDIIQNIQGHVQEYYEFIHDDDLIKCPRIEVIDENLVRLYLESFGKESEPRQFSSEGHLDTLGLCIFLAFMQEFNPLNLIVLDDIITTVDFSHKYRVALLLIEKFKDFKFLITTHNGLWAQQLNDIAKNTKKTTLTEYHIVRWNLLEGPVIYETKGYEERILKYLECDEPQVAVNTSRQYLEYTMLQFSKKFAVKIKIDNKYTLAPLKQAVKPVSLKKAEKLKDFDLDGFRKLWKDLDKNFFIVNKLSHYNDDSFYVHSFEVKQVCEIAIKLCEILNRIKRECKN